MAVEYIMKNPSRDVLIDSLLVLLKTRSFAAVSIRDIIENGQMSRSTFYRNFSDKYDMAKLICMDDLAAYQTIYGIDASWQQIVMSILHAMKKRKIFYKRLFADDDGTNIFERALDEIHLQLNARHLDPMAITAYSRILSLWAKEDFKSAPEDVMDKLLYSQPLGEVLTKEEFIRFKTLFMNKTSAIFKEDLRKKDNLP